MTKEVESALGDSQIEARHRKLRARRKDESENYFDPAIVLTRREPSPISHQIRWYFMRGLAIGVAKKGPDLGLCSFDTTPHCNTPKMARELDSSRRLCLINYAPFIHNLFDGSLINICPRRAYLLDNSDTGVTPLSAESAGEFP